VVGKAASRAKIGVLGSLSQASKLHVIEHAIPNREHDTPPVVWVSNNRRNGDTQTQDMTRMEKSDVRE